MSTRLEYWTPRSPLVVRRSRTSLSSRDNLVFGTYIPDANTAGLLYDVSLLTPYTGPFVISTPNTLIENRDCSGGYFDIRAANVVFRNCMIRGGTPPSSGNTGLILATHAACTNLLIEDCHLNPNTSSPFVDGVRGREFTLRRSIVENCADGVGIFRQETLNVNTNVVIEGSWIKGCAFFWGPFGTVNPNDNKTHNDIIQLHGGNNTLIQGNLLDAYYSRTRGHAVPPYSAIPPADVGSGGTIPDRGTGTEADGRYNWGSLIAVQFNTIVGNTVGTKVWDNHIRGGAIPVNVAINVSNAGSILRNTFTRDQGQQNVGGDRTYTVNIRAGVPCDAGEGTANKNTYLDNGHEVLVRRNA